MSRTRNEWKELPPTQIESALQGNKRESNALVRWKELPPRQIERALQGHRGELDALVRWYGPVVWGAVAARVRGVPRLAVQMEDLVGDVWLELCRNDRKRLRYYDPERGVFGYFIRMQAAQIAWGLVRAQLRRPELVSQASAEPVDQSSEQLLVDRDLLERLAQRVKSSLGPSDWLLFRAAYVDGLDAEQTAELLQKKVTTVYQQKFRLRVKLDAIVRELLHADGSGERPSDAVVRLVVASLLVLVPTLERDSFASIESSATSVGMPDFPPLDLR